MKRILNYKSFLETLKIDLELSTIDISESLKKGTFDSLLKSIGAIEKNIFDEFILPKDFDTDIDNLNNNVEFINSLSSVGLKKSQMQKTDEFETFIDKPFKFILIYGKNDNELMDPRFIVIQKNNDSVLTDVNKSVLYKISKPFKNFYEEISCKDIEINDENIIYKYSSSNGNEWELKSKNSNDLFKNILRTSELKELIFDRKVKITII